MFVAIANCHNLDVLRKDNKYCDSAKLLLFFSDKVIEEFDRRNKLLGYDDGLIYYDFIPSKEDILILKVYCSVLPSYTHELVYKLSNKSIYIVCCSKEDNSDILKLECKEFLKEENITSFVTNIADFIYKSIV